MIHGQDALSIYVFTYGYSVLYLFYGVRIVVNITV